MRDCVGGRYKQSCMGGLLVILFSLSPISQAAGIHEIAKSGHLAQLQHLILEGADLNERSIGGETPLMVAAIAGQGEIVSYLLQRGAVMDARNDSGLSALHLAARAGETDIARLLIIKGADINDGRNDFGVTPLHLASGENQVQTVRMLLEFGADTTLPDVNGDSALSRAERHEHWEVVTTLLAGGSSCQSKAKVGQRLYRECASRARDN